jgi:hypothetical protein
MMGPTMTSATAKPAAGPHLEHLVASLDFGSRG